MPSSPLLVLALAGTAAALCSDTKRRMQEAHIDVLANINERFGAPPASTSPQQLHLSLTGTPEEVFVTWVLPDAGDLCADAHATLHAPSGDQAFAAGWTKYNAGVAGWAGHVYTARMAGVAPAGARLTYSVTSCGNTSEAIAFLAPKAPGPDAHTLVAVMADMGTVIPLGFATAAQIEKDHAAEPFDLFVLAGDIAYATTDPPKDELEEVWDAYGRMVEPFMRSAPFLPNVGNRECPQRRGAPFVGDAVWPPLSHPFPLFTHSPQTSTRPARSPMPRAPSQWTMPPTRPGTLPCPPLATPTSGSRTTRAPYTLPASTARRTRRRARRRPSGWRPTWPPLPPTAPRCPGWS